ncbi:MAG: CRISPR-associated endonuclease Cas2 [Betaproteobacteria bacterium]
MSQFDSAQWLVCYDIRDPRRLGRVFRFMKKRGVPVQYSVFLVEASAQQMQRLLQDLAQIIDARVDDVRAYGLPAQPQYDTIGQSMLPLGCLPTKSLHAFSHTAVEEHNDSDGFALSPGRKAQI